MLKQPLVSIVIPAFNRAHLIGETLDSILTQSYTHWECLVIDDGSTDTTTDVVLNYAKNEKRIKLFERPVTKSKGANACRNIGLNKVQGDYVVFFDSDDLMTKDHLEIKVNAIQKFNCDYVITKTQYFNYSNEVINRYYQFDKYPITPFNYITQKINWLTYDICLKAPLAKSISFNENLHSGQEYNYFSKLVYKSINAEFIDKVVSLRRYHEKSIRSQLKENNLLNESLFITNWSTYKDLLHIAEFKSLKFLMNRCVELIFDIKSMLMKNKFRFVHEVFRIYKLKAMYFLLMIIGLRLFDKGFWFKNQLIKS